MYNKIVVSIEYTQYNIYMYKNKLLLNLLVTNIQTNILCHESNADIL